MEKLRIWVSEEFGTQRICVEEQRYHPSDWLFSRIAYHLTHLWLSGKYLFRPFLGTAFGIVVSRK